MVSNNETDVVTIFLNLAQEAVLLLNSKGYIGDCNQEAATLFGQQKDVLISRLCVDFIDKDYREQFTLYIEKACHQYNSKKCVPDPLEFQIKNTKNRIKYDALFGFCHRAGSFFRPFCFTG